MMLSNPIEAAEERLIDFDHTVHKAFKPYSREPGMKPLDLFSKLGDQPEIRTLSALVILGGIVTGRDRLMRAGVRMLVAHEAATLAKDAVKLKIDRTRPRSATKRNSKKLKKGKHTAKEKTSFPSGHSAGAIAAARAFSREYPAYGAAALAAGAAVAASQIPRCAHYPTDVIAGLAVGLASEAAMNALWPAAEGDD